MRKDLKAFYINTDGEFVVKVKEGFEITAIASGAKIINFTVIKLNRKGKENGKEN
jgi:hypothetical protein